MLFIDYAVAVKSGMTIERIASTQAVIIEEFFSNVSGHETPYCHLSFATEEQLLKMTEKTNWHKISDHLIRADQNKSQVIEILRSL